MSTQPATGYYDSLLHAPTFSSDPAGKRQAERWKRLVDDIHKSTTEQDLREARGKAEGYIIGLMESGHLPPDGERDYVILSSIHRRQDFCVHSSRRSPDPHNRPFRRPQRRLARSLAKRQVGLRL